MEFDKLKQIIASVLSVDPNEVKVDTSFLEELGADSLDVYQMVLAIENEFDIELKEEDVEKISTVGEALDLIINSRNE